MRRRPQLSLNIIDLAMIEGCQVLLGYAFCLDLVFDF